MCLLGGAFFAATLRLGHFLLRLLLLVELRFFLGRHFFLGRRLFRDPRLRLCLTGGRSFASPQHGVIAYPLRRQADDAIITA